MPDELYRKVKAKSALEGRHIREVAIELYRRWLTEPITASGSSARGANWLEELRKLQIPESAPGPTARELLEAGRERLEPKA
ncbi:MAG: hypothetical protein QHJ82_05205 [Verrucomicrobiota bacterium]|nr:hypothetical protein [Verrucomicrobiota bacterium]